MLDFTSQAYHAASEFSPEDATGTAKQAAQAVSLVADQEFFIK